MKKLLAIMGLFAITACSNAQTLPPGPRQIDPPGQLRGLWADAFGPGFKTAAEVDMLIANAQRMRVNAIFMQVGRRGDCYCNRAAMPRTQDPDVTPGFDPLAYMLEKAHAVGIQVHAWIITTSIHNSATAPTNPDHVFNTHGPSKTGRDNWLMLRSDGTNRAGSDYLLDPGHPDAAEYILHMYTSVIENYPVDGIQFDRVRYPDQNEPAGQPTWGYNPVAIERFNAETGRTGTPTPTDAGWMNWRRDQVTKLVRRISLAAKSIRPNIWVSAATITYGEGPASLDAWRTTRTYVEVLQDWVSWMQEGIIDLNIPMNYKRDHVEAQALWFNQWNAFAAMTRGWSAIASGTAVYLNTQDGTVRQVNYSLNRDHLDGWVGYNYRIPDSDVNGGTKDMAVAFNELAAKLVAGPFAQPATWGPAPVGKYNALYGRVLRNGAGAANVTVTLTAPGQQPRTVTTDGNGYYGFPIVPTGRLELRINNNTSISVEALLGSVTKVADQTIPAQ